MILPLLMCLCVQDPGARAELPLAPVMQARAPIGSLQVSVHDVSHLTGYDRSARLFRDLVSSGDAADVEIALAKLERHARLSVEIATRTEGLMGVIGAFMRPPLEGPDQRLEDLGDGRLVLVAPAPQQEWLASFLAGVADYDGMIKVEMRIWELPTGTMEALGIEAGGSTLSAPERSALEEHLSEVEADVLSVPTVVVWPFSKATLSVGDQTPYVKDYERQVIDGTVIEDPVIDVVSDGFEVELRSLPLADGRLAVDLKLTLAELVKPIREVEISLDSGNKVTIQLPEVRKMSVSATTYQRATDSSIMATIDSESRREYLIVFTAREVPALKGPQKAAEGGGH